MKKLINLLAFVSVLLANVSCDVIKNPDNPYSPDNPSGPVVVVNKLDVTALSVQKITLSSAEVSGSYEIEPVSVAVDEVGFIYGTDEDLREYTEIKSINKAGEFWSTIDGLESGTKYYWRAYVKVGEVLKKSSILSFTTIDKVIVETASVTEIGPTTAVCGGIVVSDGGSTITECGVCYSTSENPTVSDTKVVSSSQELTYSCELTGLTKNTTYHVRAYAINEFGAYYGNQVMFKTLDDTPIDYIENDKILGKSIAVYGNWDKNSSTPNTYLHWAPVNCGYEEKGAVNTDEDHRLGKLYQWGAGDPNLYDGKALSTYYDDATPSNWQTSLFGYSTESGYSTDMWNNNQGPCPNGWRLPTYEEFIVLCGGVNGDYGWVDAGSGSTSNYAGQKNIYDGAEFFGANTLKIPGTGVFFPAVGERYPHGLSSDRGINGYYWSSTSGHELCACSLGIAMYDYSRLKSIARACGCSVRCVADPK